jgi:hypothetical protein
MNPELDTPESLFDVPAQPLRQRRTRRRWWLLAAVVVAAAAVATVVVTDPFSTGTPSKAGLEDNSDPTGVTTAERQDLSSQTELTATLGYAGTYSVVNQMVAANGAGGSSAVFTSLPAVGQLVSQGQVLYRVNDAPVVLLYGTTPAYRTLAEGASASDVTGPDVAELNADLVALGYATTSEIPVGSNTFTWWTKDAIEKLQADLGVTQTGTLTLGQAMFLPAAIRLTSVSATLSGPAQAGTSVLTATSTARQVSIALNASQQSEMKTGDKVTISLPDNRTTPGVIASVGTVAVTPPSGTTGSPTITVLVTPTDPAATGNWDQAPVNVTVTTATVKNALVVPVDALVALAGGGYAVETVGTGGLHHLVDVTLGLFDDADGLVQVTNTDLAAGQKIVVPAT